MIFPTVLPMTMGLTVDLVKLVTCFKTIRIVVSSSVLASTNLESHPDGIPASGFQEIGVDEIFGPTTQELVALSGSLLDGKVNGLNLFKGFKATQENKEFFRLIFYTNQGFLETVLELREPDNESLLLQSKIYERQTNETFINIGSDPQMPEVEAFIRSNYTELANAELVDAWKSDDSQNNKTSYRVFLLDPNIGLREAIVKVDPTPENSTETQIFVPSNLTQEILNFVKEVIEKENLTDSLSNTTLSHVVKTEEGNSDVFYVLYNHTEILLPTGLPAQSYFIFNVAHNTSIPIFIRSYLYPLINNNSIITIQSDAATEEAIQMGPLQVYINKNSVQNSTVFPYIRQILQRSYANIALSSQLYFAAHGHNTTHEVYEIVYKSFGKDPMFYTFMFALKKDVNVLSLVRFFSYPESSKLVIKLSPSNQSQAMETAEPTMISILFSLVTTEPLFNPIDILEQMTRVEYYSIDPDSKLNASVVAYYFKYKSNSSSVEFRYELSTSIMRLLPNLIYPLEQFKIVARQNVEIIALITDFIGHTLNQTNISKFTIENISESIERKQVYRVGLNLVRPNGSEWRMLYEFDIEDGATLQVIEEQEINNSTQNNTSNETNETNSTNNTSNTSNPNNTNSNVSIEELLKEIISQKELSNTTMSRLKEFVELQFQPELSDKLFIYARKLNVSSYPEAITGGGSGDVVEFVYGLNGKGLAIIVGLGHDSWQVQIVSSREVSIDPSVIEAVKKFYETPETPSSAELVQEAYPELSSTFESMTNNSLDSDKIKSIEWGDWGMAVEDHLGRNFSFEKEKPYPEMNSQPLSINISELQSSLLNTDIIKSVISEILNVKAEEIQNLDIKNVTSLLGLLDTYTVQFDLVSKQNQMGSEQKHTFIFEVANNGTLIRDYVDAKPSSADGITIISETTVLTNSPTIPPTLTNPLTTPLTYPQQLPLTLPLPSPPTSTPLTSGMPIPMPRPILTSTLPLNQPTVILTSSQRSEILTETNENRNESTNMNESIFLNDKKEKIKTTFFREFMHYQKGTQVNLAFNQSQVNIGASQIIPILYISNETFSLSEMSKLGPISPVSFNASSILSRYGGNYQIVSQRSSLEGITSIQAISPKYDSLNFVANLSSNKLYRIEFQDAGFYVRGTGLNLKQFPNEESVEKIISPQLGIILSEYSLMPNTTLNFSNKVNLSHNNLVFWKVKKSANVEEIEMNYEIFSYLVRVKGLLRRKEIEEFELTIFEMNVLWNNLEELENEVRNSRQHQIDMFKSRFEFQEAEKELMKNYGFYVGNSNILDISMNEFRGEISFEITYQTSYGKMEGRVAYSIENKTSRIIYLVIPRSKPFSIIEKGCKTMLDSGLGCLECQNSFYLDINFHCYPSIKGCFMQSGSLCVNCHDGYFISEGNECL